MRFIVYEDEREVIAAYVSTWFVKVITERQTKGLSLHTSLPVPHIGD